MVVDREIVETLNFLIISRCGMRFEPLLRSFHHFDAPVAMILSVSSSVDW